MSDLGRRRAAQEEQSLIRVTGGRGDELLSFSADVFVQIVTRVLRMETLCDGFVLPVRKYNTGAVPQQRLLYLPTPARPRLECPSSVSERIPIALKSVWIERTAKCSKRFLEKKKRKTLKALTGRSEIFFLGLCNFSTLRAVSRADSDRTIVPSVFLARRGKKLRIKVVFIFNSQNFKHL